MPEPEADTNLPQPSAPRWPVIAAAVLAGILAVWQGLSMRPAQAAVPAGATSYEARLGDILETVTGPGHVRVIASRNGQGARRLLVLVDTARPLRSGEKPLLRDLLAASAGLDRERGDTIEFRELEFASGGPFRANLAEQARLAGLFGLAGLLGWVALARPAPAHASAHDRPDRPRQTDGEPVEPVADPGKPAHPAALAAATADPARAAAVIRSWIGRDGASA